MEVAFEPEIKIDLEGSKDEKQAAPFRTISLLKPGQELSSWIGRMFNLIDHCFTVTISWSVKPNGERQSYHYTLDMRTYRNVHRLGSGDPLVQIANSTKSIKEDVHRVIGSGKLRVDAYSHDDRERDEQA